MCNLLKIVTKNNEKQRIFIKIARHFHEISLQHHFTWHNNTTIWRAQQMNYHWIPFPTPEDKNTWLWGLPINIPHSRKLEWVAGWGRRLYQLASLVKILTEFSLITAKRKYFCSPLSSNGNAKISMSKPSKITILFLIRILFVVSTTGPKSFAKQNCISNKTWDFFRGHYICASVIKFCFVSCYRWPIFSGCKKCFLWRFLCAVGKSSSVMTPFFVVWV